MTQAMGKRQTLCLEALIRHRTWPSGWVWTSYKQTAAILDTLVQRGLVEHTDDGSRFGKYTPTAAGREYHTRLAPTRSH